MTEKRRLPPKGVVRSEHGGNALVARLLTAAPRVDVNGVIVPPTVKTVVPRIPRVVPLHLSSGDDQ